jgi:hypothetical protein
MSGQSAGLFRRLFRSRSREPERLVDDGSLVLLVRAFEVERGDAAALEDLAASGHDLAAPVLLRHVFVVHPGSDPSDLAHGLEADGYEVDRPSPDRLRAATTTIPTVLATSQARARMTGLTTRFPVDYLGWEALGPPAGETAAGR